MNLLELFIGMTTYKKEVIVEWQMKEKCIVNLNDRLIYHDSFMLISGFSQYNRAI